MSKDYDFFAENVVELYKQYGPVFVVIKDEQVLGAYSSIESAVVETAKTHKLGTFIVQQCAENPESLVAHFAGNVV